jgi:hypothetical protein
LSPSEKEKPIQQLVRILPWVALGCAFSPVLIQLTHTVPKVYFGWSVLLAPALMISLGVRDRHRALPRRGWAQALLAIGLLIELIGLAGGSPGIARVGLPVSIVGLVLWTGAPSVKTAMLAFWAVPIPVAIYGLTTPNLESAYAQIGAAFGALLGADIHASGPLMRAGVDHLELDPYHNGLHLTFIMTQLVWYAAVRNGASVLQALGRMVCVAVAAVPLQVLAVLVAVLLLLAGAPEAANLWLDHGAWPLIAILGLVWIETR